MVTIYTASLTFNNSTFCPHSVFMCFVWISEQTTIISLYSINWLVLITEIYPFKGPVVTICTVSLTFNNSTFCHTVHLCVLCGSENKQRLFIYTALTDWFLNRNGECLLRGMDWNFTIHFTNPTPYIDRTVAQAVSRRPLATEVHYRLQARPSEICGVQSGTATVFYFPHVFPFPQSVSFHHCSYQVERGRYLEVFTLIVLFRKSGRIG